MRISPKLAQLGTYPFVQLDQAKDRMRARGVPLIDFGVGDPREETPAFIRQALADAITPRSNYPRAVGLPELREAIGAWVAGRFGVRLDPATEIIPTLGSKELIFSLAQVVIDPDGGKDLVLTTTPAYDVPRRGALMAGAEVVELPLQERNGFLPDLDAVDAATWQRAALVWVNYPNNPTAAVAPLSFYQRLAELARRHGVLLASDEAYSELWYDQPPASALQVGDRSNVVAVNTLSKRSCMTGYRSGFVAGDPRLVGALTKYRPSTGVTPQEFVQRASIAAWGDEAHVEALRKGYAAKRRVLLDVLGESGLHIAGSAATFYLWAAVPEGETSLGFAQRLLEDGGIIVTPGSFLGAAGEGYVRVALVPTLEECERAATLLAKLL
jgi:succinyldiaminopimelate transaminase